MRERERESASRFSRGTLLNTLKQSGINILRRKKDATTFSTNSVNFCVESKSPFHCLLTDYLPSVPEY